MEQWVDIGTKLGIAGLLIVAAGYAWAKQIWPFIVQQVKDAKAERQAATELAKVERQAAKEEREANAKRNEEQARLFTESLQREREDNARRFEDQGKIFMETIRRQNVLADQIHKESMKAQNKIVDKLETIERHIKNGNGK